MAQSGESGKGFQLGDPELILSPLQYDELAIRYFQIEKVKQMRSSHILLSAIQLSAVIELGCGGCDENFHAS